MEEKYIRNRIYSIITKRRPDAIDHPWYIDDYLANMGALIYPYIRDKNIDTIEKLEFFVNSIKAFCRGKRKDFLISLNENSLIRVLTKEWVPRIDDKIQLALSLPIVESVNDEGFVIFKEKLFAVNLIINVPFASQKYGSVEFSYPTIDEKTPNSPRPVKQESIISIAKKPKPPKRQWQPQSQEEKDLLDFWEKNQLPTKLEKGDYFWQTGISHETYEKLKELLILLDFKKNPSLYLRYAFQISFFLAQWFMREYDGYLCERGLDQLGLLSTKSRQIWEKAKLPDAYLINSGQNEWLFSMYVLGGFPIKYITRVKRFDALFKNIWIKRKDEDLDEETIDIISEQFDSSNSVYRASLMKGGSLYAYINRIIDNDYPLEELDKIREPYFSFCNLLDEGKRKCFDNFFTSEWRFYTDEDQDGLETELRVQIGYKNDRCYIPYDCVKGWKNIGDASQITDFLLGLESDKGEKSRGIIRFSKTGDTRSPFVGWGHMSSLYMDVDISTLEYVYVVMYSIDDEHLNNGLKIHTIDRRNHYQIFQTADSYCWSTRTHNSSCSALIFTPSKYKVLDNKSQIVDIIPSESGKYGWCWTRIYDNIALEDTNQNTLNFYVHKGKLGVRFKGHPGLWMNEQNEVEYTYLQGGDETTNTLPILFGINGIREVKYYPFEHDKEVLKLKNKNYKVEFKQDEWSYQLLNKENQPRCGLIYLRVSDDIHSKIIRCFYIPNDSVFSRNISDKTIIFKDLGQPIWVEDEDGEFEPIDTPYIYQDNIIDRFEDYIPFRIGTSDEYITMKIARADNCKEIYFNNDFLTQLDRQKELVSIPLILKNRFDIRKIDENGVKRISLKDTTLLDFHFIDYKGRYLEIREENRDKDVCYYLYTDKFLNLKNGLKISYKQKDNYDFYFWSMEEMENPIRINCSYDIVKKMLTVPIDILSRRNGLIFQSLRDATPPNYMRPFYTTKVPWQILMQRIYSEEICLKSIEIAALHNVYFSQFPPIYKLMTGNNKTGVELISLVVKYMRRQQPFTRKHATYLHRFADEFLFDWMLLPTYLWKSICEPNDYKNVELLFRSSPHIQSQSERAYLDAIVNLYWKLPTSYLWKFNKSSHPSNIALRLMQSGDNEYFFFTRKKKKNEYEMLEAEKLIKMLESFRNTDTFYQHLYWLIQDKIIKS